MSSHSTVAAALAMVLLLAGTAGAQAPAQDDAALASSVRTQLSKHYGESAAANIKVEIKDGAVGIVASGLSPAQRAQALGLIRSLPGVTRAVDFSVGGSAEIIGEEGAQAGASAGSAPDPNLSETVRKANVAGTPGLAGPGMRGGTRVQPGGIDGTAAGVAPLPGVSPEGNDNENVPGKNTNVRVVDGAAGGTGVAGGTPLPGFSPEGNDNGGRDGNDNGGGPPVSGPENSRAVLVGGEQGGGIIRPPNQYGNKNENPPGKNDNTRLTGGILAHPEDEPAEPAPRGGNTNGPRLQGLYGKSPDNDNKAGGGIKIDVSDAQLARNAQAVLAARFGAAAAAQLRVSANAGVVRVEAMAGNSLGRAEIDAALQNLPASREIDVP